MILALDTATSSGSIALVSSDKVIVSRYFDLGIHHAQHVFSEIETICKLANSSIKNLTAVAISIGPGSFTGLRIGLAAAKGLCLVDNLPLLAISSLEIIAARLPFVEIPVCPIIDARKQQVYAALYNVSSGFPECISEPEAIAPATIFERRSGEPTFYTGDGSVAYAKEIGQTPKAMRVPIHCDRPHADALGVLGWRKLELNKTADIEKIEPFYVRGADAEISQRKTLL